MSTRSHIGYIKPDGSIVAVYNHFDGYPSNLLKNCLDFISSRGIETFRSEIDRGCREAGFQSFPTSYKDFHGETGDWTVTDRIALDNDYAYLFGSSGELIEAYRYGKVFDTASALREAFGDYDGE